MTKLNHSRYLDYGAKRTGDRAYERSKTTPTYKQKSFYNRLFAICKEHGIDTDLGFYTKTRADYALAIDRLIKRLRENGVDIKGNNKNAGLMLIHAADKGGHYTTKERIIITDDEEGTVSGREICKNCKHYYARNTSSDGGTCEKYEVFRDGNLTCTDWANKEDENS